jgi:hypothetical protein
MRIFYFLLPFILFANEPLNSYLRLFYNQSIRETRNAVHGTAPDSGFANQHFFLWDYAEDAPKQQSYVDHYSELFVFALANQVPKVIVFPKDPDQPSNAFFAISNQSLTNDNCFLFWINLMSELGIQVEVLFEFDAFNPSGTATPVYALPNPFYFLDLPQKMNWLKSLIQLAPKAVSSVTIDPEGPGSGGNDGYQQVINYIDQYRFANGLPNLKIGMTFGIDAKPMSFANLDTFPVNALYISPPPSSYFPANPLPSYRAAGNNVPLINNVYLQAYEPDFDLFFTENLNPTLAANTFIEALQDIPYKTSYGTITIASSSTTGSYVDGGQFVSSGTITCTAGNAMCTYTGDNFTSEITVGAFLDYNQSGTVIPIGQVSSTPQPPNPVTKVFYFIDTTAGATVTLTNQQFVLSQFAVELPEGGTINTTTDYPVHPDAKIGAIDSLIVFGNPGYDANEHQFLLDSGAAHPLTDQHFLTSEVVMKWIYPPITPAIAAGINFMFSVNYDIATDDLFFGNWSLANFMAFVNQFTSQVSGATPANPIFTNASSGGVPLPSTNLGIYDYYFLLLTNTNPAQNTTPPAPPNPPPSPTNPWFPEFPPP